MGSCASSVPASSSSSSRARRTTTTATATTTADRPPPRRRRPSSTPIRPSGTPPRASGGIGRGWLRTEYRPAPGRSGAEGPVVPGGSSYSRGTTSIIIPRNYRRRGTGRGTTTTGRGRCECGGTNTASRTWPPSSPRSWSTGYIPIRARRAASGR